LSILSGGPHEEGRRAGTENYPGIAAMVAALEGLVPRLSVIAREQAARRDAFEMAMQAKFPELRVIGQGADRLWNTSMFVLPRGDNRKWLARLSQGGFAVSTGSACSAGHDGSSVVLSALGASADEMRRVIRVSGGWDTTADDWRALAEGFATVGAGLY
jgi:cysteine desulfurase